MILVWGLAIRDCLVVWGRGWMDNDMEIHFKFGRDEDIMQ